jgi:hypothetical protein
VVPKRRSVVGSGTSEMSAEGTPMEVVIFRMCRKIKALEPFDWSARLQGVSVLACDMSRRGRCSEYFSASDIEIVRGHDLDFILRCGIARGEILRAPRYGLWSFHHDDVGRPPS